MEDERSRLKQENRFMVEALNDLQDSTSRLEAENRALKKNASPSKLAGASGSGVLGKVSQVVGIKRSIL